MHISGAFNLQRRFPELYQSLLKAQHDKEIGKFLGLFFEWKDSFFVTLF